MWGTHGGTLHIHTVDKSQQRQPNPTHILGLAWKNIGKIAKQLDDFKKLEFLLGSRLCLEPEVSSLVGVRAGTLNYRADKAVVDVVHKYVWGIQYQVSFEL